MLQRPSRRTRILIYRGVALSALFILQGFAPAYAADPTGDWKVADQVATIRVAECNGSMWGVVASEKNPGGTDKNNPDVSKQNRPTLGLPILIDMKKNAAGDKWAGQVYNAKDGKLYKSTISLASPDELEIQGCVLGFLCGGETWTRVGPPIASSPSNLAAKGGMPKTTGVTAQKPVPPAPKPPAPGAPRPGGQKMAAGQTAPDVGDICLLPDIARFTH